jgi:uncharacterized repeat protein (TIGR01451 family)
MRFALPASAALLLLSASLAATPQPVQTFALNDYKRELDGQWEGIRLASDGNVYFASASHSAHVGAAFFRYDTGTGQVTELAHEITDICGEDVQTNPQGKIHSDVVEANGWLYMATHFAAEKPGTYAAWTGSHALGYELATGQWRDYGVLLPGYTGYAAVGVDPARNFLYVFLTSQVAGQPAYVYRVDTVTGDKINLGQVSAPTSGGYDYASFWTFVDQRGDVWLSIKNQNGDLLQIHGDTGLIEVHSNALPALVRWDSDQLETDAVLQSSRYIQWMQPLDGDRALLTLANGGMLYLFDATQPMASAFTEIRHIGYNYLGLAVGGNRVFYYQRENRAWGNQDAPQNYHLMSVSLDSSAGYPITDHGLMVDQGGRTVWRAPGMMTDGLGKVYMIGDWWTVPGDLGTLRYNWNGGNETYEQLPRGEFFAVASVSTAMPAPVDLAITASDTPDPVMVNGQVTYSIQAANSGSTPATGVTVSDLLPAGTTYVSATTPAGTCSAFSRTVTCQILGLAAGGAATVTVTIKAPTGAGVLTNTVHVSANETDANAANDSATQTTAVLESVQFSNHTYTVSESGGNAVITVTRTGTGAVSVGYATADNTASAGSDYATTQGTLSFAPGESSKTLAIPITSDTAAEGNEFFQVSLSAPAGALIGPNNAATVTILDDDVFTPPTLDFSAADYAVGEATATKSITVKRTGDAAGTVTVAWSAVSNTATLGVDFAATGGVLTFDPGVTSRSFNVGITNDTAAEGNETGYLILSNPTGGARIGASGVATLTITDNDVSTAGFKFNATNYVSPESGAKVVTITRTSTTAVQSVTFATSDGTAVAGSDYTPVTATLTFAVGEASKKVSLPILADTIVESKETVNLTLSNPTGGGTLGPQRTAVLFITDNDGSGSLQFKTATFLVAEGKASATITVTRTGGASGAVDVDYATSDWSATAGTDYTTRSGTLSFGSGQTSKTFTVPILNDKVAEGVENLNLTLSNPTGGATLGQARRALLTITDND